MRPGSSYEASHLCDGDAESLHPYFTRKVHCATAYLSVFEQTPIRGNLCTCEDSITRGLERSRSLKVSFAGSWLYQFHEPSSVERSCERLKLAYHERKATDMANGK